MDLHWFSITIAHVCTCIHSVPSLADIGHSSADDGTISSHCWNKMNDNARSNPGSSFIFLMTSHTIFLVFYYYITFFILFYINILEFHSILYAQLLIPVILLTSTVDVFVCWLESNLGYLICDSNTLPLGYRALVPVEFWWVLDDNSD